MSISKKIAFFAIVFLVILGGYIQIDGIKINALEKTMIEDSSIKIESITQYSFGEGGLILVGVDSRDNGIVEAYTKIPLVNRYILTKRIEFEKSDMPVRFAGESWSGFQALSFDGTKLKMEETGTGLGFAGRMIFWAALATLLSMGATIGLTAISKKRQK